MVPPAYQPPVAAPRTPRLLHRRISPAKRSRRSVDPMSLDEGELPPESPLRSGGGGGAFPRMPQGASPAAALLLCCRVCSCTCACVWSLICRPPALPTGFPQPGASPCLASACLFFSGLPRNLEERELRAECGKHSKVRLPVEQQQQQGGTRSSSSSCCTVRQLLPYSEPGIMLPACLPSLPA